MKRPSQIGRHLLALVITFFFILPLFWAVIASLRQVGLGPQYTISWWPTEPHWQNYRQIFTALPMWTYTRNSLFVVLVAVPLTLLTASLAGFAMAQIAPYWRDKLFRLSLVMLLIPSIALWLFKYQLFRWVGLLDSLWALIIPAVAGSSPLFVLLFYASFRRIPDEIFEAARLDGAEAWQLYRQIALPMATPAILGVMVLSFVMYWNDFINPVLFLYSADKYTLAVGMQLMKQLDITNIPLLMATAVFMTLPVALLFVGLQRFFLTDVSLAQLIDKN
jgi:multiple sugar transport system permease protein